MTSKDYSREAAKLKLRVQARMPFWGSFIHGGGGTQYLPPDKAEMPSALAYTDGKSVVVTQELLDMPTENQDFVLVHELVHKQHLHPLRGKVARKRKTFASLPFDETVWYHTVEAVCNAHALACQIGKPPQGSFFDPEVTYKDSIVDVYRRYYAKREELQLPPGGDLLEPTEGETTDAELRRQETDMRSLTKAAASISKSMGATPGDYERWMEEQAEPKVDWRQQLHGLLKPWTGMQRYDFTRMNKRIYVRSGGLVIAPRRSGVRAGTALAVGDSSGSMGQREMDQFFGEVRGMMEAVRPQRTIVTGIDCKEPDTWADLANPEDIRGPEVRKAVKGGGGTSFVPAFTWVARMGFEPDFMIYVTDGYGTFPEKAPSYPVFWCVTTDHAVPWGTRIQVDLD